MRTEPPPTPPRTALPGHPQRAPARAKLTDRLLYTWERLRPAQREAAWEMVESMRATMASERRTRRVLALAVLFTVVVAGVLLYLLLTAPTH
jgi:hypothetical protein